MDKGNGDAEKLTSSTSAQPSRRFTIAEIQSITNNFDDELVIGQGGFGKVYKGQISIEESSHFVAIKRLDSMSNQGAAEFKAEIEMLSNLRHCNLVSLIGYCDDNREMILVYVYMPRGTLYDHLHKVTATPLSWIQRLKIAIGAGWFSLPSQRVLASQHGSHTSCCEEFAYNVSVSVKGTFGYLDPEYFYTSKLTRKTDVYAFGVVLFELLSGKLAVDRDIEEEQGTIAPKCLRGFAEIANRCLIRDFEKRPSMTQVVAKLQDLLELQEKCDNSADSPGTTSGFNWMIRQYRGSSGANMNHCNPLSTIGDDDGLQEMPHQWTTVPTEDLKEFTYDELKLLPEALDSLVISMELVLSLLRHPNIVKLIGYCLEGDVLFLVYEFMHNGNFEDCLHSGAVARLPLDTRVKMALGIARGLVFLHSTQDKSASDWSWIQKSVILKFLYGRVILASFTLVLAEILIGEPVPGSNAYKNLSLQDFGKHMEILKEWKSLGSLAKTMVLGSAMTIDPSMFTNLRGQGLQHSQVANKKESASKSRQARDGKQESSSKSRQARVGKQESASKRRQARVVKQESASKSRQARIDKQESISKNEIKAGRRTNMDVMKDSRLRRLWTWPGVELEKTLDVTEVEVGCPGKVENRDGSKRSIKDSLGEWVRYIPSPKDSHDLVGTIASKCLRGFAEIANRCLIRDFEKRPSMTQVVAKLQDLLELQEKCDNSADSPGTSGFTWMIRKYRTSATNQNSGQGGTGFPKSNEKHMNQGSLVNRDGGDIGKKPHEHGELVAGDIKIFTYDALKTAIRNFKNHALFGLVGYEKWWIHNTGYSPSMDDTGLPILVKILDSHIL
ncbi:kinase RLK-Pelle-CrRLK1L-1 family protein, partial [Tanacetum coccineum]